MKTISFAFSAVARIAVPPGKWFCLARTGLGYKQYSCCVCGLHSDVFHKHWSMANPGIGWKARVEQAVEGSLAELGYTAHSGADAVVMKNRIFSLLLDKDSYLVSPAFSKLLESSPSSVRILTDGPDCMVKLVFPSLQPDQIITNKSKLTQSELSRISDSHVGSSLRDLRVPQTKYLVNRSMKEAADGVRIFPRLTGEALKTILSS